MNPRDSSAPKQGRTSSCELSFLSCNASHSTFFNFVCYTVALQIAAWLLVSLLLSRNMVKLDCGVREGEPCIFFFLTLTWRGAHRKYPSCMVSTGTSGTWRVKLCIQVSSSCRPRLTPTGCSSTGCSAFERCDQIIVNVLHCVNILEMTNYCCYGRRHSLYSLEREELYSSAIWLCQSCDKCLSTNHKVSDSVYLLFHCSCIQVLQYITLSIAALGNNVLTISTGKNYPVPETITLQLTDTEKCQHLLLWLTVIFHPIFQISSPQDWVSWASVAILCEGEWRSRHENILLYPW